MSELAYALGPQPGGGGAAGGGFSMLVPLLLMFAVFYFLLIRPQQKKQRTHQDMLKSLKVGDRIITTGGLVGTIVDGGEHSIKLEIADKVRVEVGRTYIAGRIASKDSKDAQPVSTSAGQTQGSGTGSSPSGLGGFLGKLFGK
ncbi:MAG TPA: preprotein translocase subunit YajC [Candidatus Methylomirabilis sp.]|nr:preprotein translocase subunit YajC [Candidatus Methylomirabilis sp.]